MRYILLLAMLGLSAGCDSPVGSSDPIPGEEPERIQMACVDQVTMWGSLQAIVRTQEEYEGLIYQRFDKPLQDYWDANYAVTLAHVVEQNPGLSEEEYEELVRAVFYSALPFRGTENCEHPEVDFTVHTLLGMDAHASGCRPPTVDVRYLPPRDDAAGLLTVSVYQHGDCDAAFSGNVWVLVPRIPEGAEIRFDRRLTIQ